MAVAIGAALLLRVAVSAGDPPADPGTSEGLLFGVWNVVYDTVAPSWDVVVAAIALALLFAAGVAGLERRIVRRSHRSTDPQYKPLGPRLVMEATSDVYAGPVTVTVLIPAHNEEASLGATIASLFSQSHSPERVVVVADNCTDSTVAVARRHDVEVIESVDNTDKKAGALNQAMLQILPGLGENDVVMVMDADTSLDPGFLATAVDRMTQDRALMAVGGLFYGDDSPGVLAQFQRNEYIRYAREIRRRRGLVFVLTGTASLFRPRALRAVAASRGRFIPGTPGDVYDTTSLTEDNELTIALKTLGALMISPSPCTVVTELMPSWRTLWAQRLRWQRGALENLGAYGITPQTFRYWVQQLGIGYGVIALGAYFTLMVIMLLAQDVWIWFPFWVGLGLVFAVERVVTVWPGGWKARLLGAALLPELVFAAVLNVIYVKGILDIALGRTAKWQHVSHTLPPDAVPQVVR